MPVLLLKSDIERPGWPAALRARLPDLEVRVWPALGDPGEIDYALVWRPGADLLTRLPALRIIFSLGAGLDHLLNERVRLPPGVPIVRMVDPALTEGMSEYAVYMSLRFHRRMGEYDAQQRERVWRVLTPQPRAGERCIGVMGLGEIGGDIAVKLAGLGFDVSGWSRSPRKLENVRTLHGEAGLAAMLERSQILICVLPLTGETRGILNRDSLGRLPRGSYLINAGRGAHLVEDDLLSLLASGHLAGAALDVFEREPLAPTHPFWDHPRIVVTPHAASLTNPETAAVNIVDNIRRQRAGQALRNLVDPVRGY